MDDVGEGDGAGFNGTQCERVQGTCHHHVGNLPGTKRKPPVITRLYT